MYLFEKGILSLLLLFLVGGCAALTDSQRKTVADYAQLTQAYSQYPSQVAKSYVELTYEIDQLRIAADVVDSTAVSHLWDSYHSEEDNLNKARKIDQGINTVREYAKALESLSTVDIPNNFGKNATLFGNNVDTLISKYNTVVKPDKLLPLGFGKLATEILTFAGKQYINQRQAVALRKFMAKGDTLLQLITNDMKTSLQPVKEEWGEKALKPHLASYYGRLLHRSDVMSPNRFYYKYQLDKEVAALLVRIASLEALADALQKSVMSLSQAHHTVLEDIQQKRTLKGQVADIQQLYQATNDIYENYQKLTNPKKTN